ncbi:MAG: FxsC protein, partial [Pseudonocardiaceae bacterium]
QQLGKRPDVIIPVLWESVETIGRLPAVAEPLQYDQQKLGTHYSEQGLRRMVQHEARFPDYEKIVEHLAELIVKAADTHALPRSAERLSITKLTNAFALAGGGGSSPAASVPVAVAPRQVHLIVCAGTAEEMGPLRDPGGRYGSTPEEWMPFRPAAQEPILAYAIDVARQRKLTPLSMSIDDDLAGRIKLAEKRNTLVILLIDGWSVRLASYERRLAPYDDYLSLHTAVVVPYDRADPETQRELPALRARVRDVFRKNHGERRPSFRDGATSLEEFQSVLHEVLVHVESRIFTDGEVARRATAEEPIGLPTLSGPGGV